MTKARDDLGEWLTMGHGFVPEVRGLILGRRFRADWAKVTFDDGDQTQFVPEISDGVVVEYDGIMSAGPSHMSITKVMRDQEKSNLLQLAGFIVIRCNAKTVQSGDCYTWITAALALKGLLDEPE